MTGSGVASVTRVEDLACREELLRLVERVCKGVGFLARQGRGGGSEGTQWCLLGGPVRVAREVVQRLEGEGAEVGEYRVSVAKAEDVVRRKVGEQARSAEREKWAVL
jgi:hypothetical protein